MKYELMVILDPKLSETALEKSIKNIKKFATENALAVLDEDIWGHRNLAYKIKGYSQGYYVIMTFEGEGEGTLEFKNDLRLQNEIIRFMFLRMADDYNLMRYEKPTPGKGKPQKLSRHAEELSEKVRASKKTVATSVASAEDASTKEDAPKEEEPAKEKAEEPAETNDSDLDEKLQAIVDDADIDL